MGENADRWMRTTGRRARFVSAAASFGAVAVALVMLLSPMASAGVAHPAAFKGASWYPSESWSTAGCGSVKMTAPHFATLTGAGRWAGSATAATCAKSVGTTGLDSNAQTSGQINVVAPLHLATGSGGVNVTWSLQVAWSYNAAVNVTNPTCPGSTSNYSYYEYWIPTWYNYTYTSSYCSADASVSLSGDAYVEDTTTGIYSYATNYWYGISSGFSWYTDTYTTTSTYSNPSYWVDNGTSWSTYGSQHGPTHASGNFSASTSPTWFINGTFVKTDKYLLFADIAGSVSAYVDGLKHSSTRASIDGASGTNHMDLVATIW
jgi:hypothetical protein